MSTKRQVSNSEDENDLHFLTTQNEDNCSIKLNQNDQTPGGTKRRKKNVSGTHDSSVQRSLVFIGKERTQKENSVGDIERQNKLNQQQKQNDEINVNYYDQEISLHALHYAVEQQLPPIKINCEPRINNHSQGVLLIKQLFLHIEKDFRQVNKMYKHSLGFEYWFVDKQGNLVCFTREPELYVYLCDIEHYPSSLHSINISPEIPKHLPPQYSVLLKSVSNSISYNDILDDIKSIYPSLFKLEEMNGTRKEQSRHIRMDLKDKHQYDKIINEGVLTLHGQLIEVSEFLAPPRLLICSKCNDPGHIRKNCKFQYDACRRCGQDRWIGEHKDCRIHCHRCESNDHMANDYKCPYIAEYRKKLVLKLKQHPELLPPNVQLFVPSECRQRGGQVSRMITNRSHFEKNLIRDQPYVYNSEGWNSLPQPKGQMPYRHLSQTSITNNNMNNIQMLDEIKKTSSECERLKMEMEKKDAEVKEKLEQQNKHFQQILVVATQLIHQQANMLEQFTKAVNETLSVVQQVINNNDGLKNGGQKEVISSLINTCQSLIHNFNTSHQQHNLQNIQILPLIMNNRIEEMCMPQNMVIHNG
ncbi:unnamed protein product [Rotaria sp. Silwood1]|nr:unnamed protein product [Rotaria sp. Silwood1]CAF1282647.1 unnamed protein product [Rotaria sp. Silwood1]CAF3493064.1 unnamed protein product [Rotaria sp. Silwood1]CAF3513882.1 unnamed protein product [Rotaria sp. Silwood1]CAF4626676.1 unnamed protein product [Rotaria sp. Silwood1]